MQSVPRTAASTFDRVASDLAHAAFPDLAAALHQRCDRILKQWRRLSLQAMPHLDALTLAQFEDAVAVILSAAADAFQSADPRKLRGVIDESPVHGIDRFAQQYSLLDLFEEVRILRGVVISELAAEMRRPLEPNEAATFHAIFDIIVQQGVMALVQKRDEDLEKSQATTRDINEQLVVAGVRQHELLEQARIAEEALRQGEHRLADELAASEALRDASIQLIQEENSAALYERILDSGAAIMHSDFASLQMFHPERGDPGELQLLAFRGFNPDAAKFWEWVRPAATCSCGRALDTGERCIVGDIEECDWMAGSDNLVTYRQTGIRAVQSTPLLARDGRLLGMMSTHWRVPHEPSTSELRKFDVLARQAADLLERSVGEAALRESEERYRTLFELGPVAIYSVDASGVIQEFNPQAAKLWGREPALGDTDELFCGSFKMFRPDGSFMAHENCPMAEVISGTLPEVHDAEVHIERPDGSHVAVIVNIRPLLCPEGKLVGAVNCFYDISERKRMEHRIKQQAEQLAEESRRKDEFLAMLSHELRNPLAPIRSAVHFLKLQERGSENLIQKQAREIIERQVNNLTRLISDLLEVSRVVSGRIHLNRQVIDLNQIIQQAAQTVTSLVEQHHHTLKLSLCPDPIWANADSTRMEEVFINLLNNAAKYTPDGGIIEVHCEHPHGESHAQVRVRDNGVGIEAKLLPRIFDLFTQADRTLDRSAGGLGIGLSLVQKVVELHGGSVEAHSPPRGKSAGSEFIVKLPLTHAPAREYDRESLSEGETPSREAAGIRVLIVDDNMDLVLTVSNSLRESGYSIQSACSGPEGLRVAQQWRPDVALLDIGLPGMDGYGIARRLRADPATRKMRLIALTGYGRDSDVAQARQAGFDAHLVKPYEFSELEKLIVAPWPAD